MRREALDGLAVLRFESIPPDRLHALVSTRAGGRSRPPYASLNLGLTVGDDEADVLANRESLFAACGLDLARSVWCRQVHGDRVSVVEALDAGRGSRGLADAVADADGLITDQAGVTLCITTADCVPVVLYDPVRHAAGIAHAGWGGTVARVAGRAVAALRGRYGSDPANLLAAVGPSIARADYEVGPEVVTAVEGSFGAESARVLSPLPGGKALLDLWEANALDLEQAGVARGRIEVAGISTAGAAADLYSHRAEGLTGRFVTAVCLGGSPVPWRQRRP